MNLLDVQGTSASQAAARDVNVAVDGDDGDVEVLLLGLGTLSPLARSGRHRATQ